MFKKAFSGALTVEIGDVALRFESPAQFEFALGGRVGLPSSKVISLLAQPDDVLLREGEGMRQIEQRFVEVLSRSMETGSGVGAFLAELDSSMISQDHDWRSVIGGLNRLDASYEEYKRIAMVKYMQYLASRQEVVNAVYARRQMEREEQGAGPEASEAAPVREKMRDTMVFDVARFEPAERGEEELSRLPKGETIEIVLQSHQSFALLLAKHRFGISCDEGLHFIDDEGNDSLLHTGKNIVGREAGNDVPIDATYRDVSRKHLIIETDGAHVLRLTDISSLGTFVPPDFLDRTNV